MIAAARAAADLPAVDPAWDWVWEAWWRLHPDRPSTITGAGSALGTILIRPKPGRLPWELLRAWADYAGYCEEDFELFDRCCGALDEVFLAWFAEQQEKAMK
jgi:hypothetical protein